LKYIKNHLETIAHNRMQFVSQYEKSFATVWKKLKLVEYGETSVENVQELKNSIEWVSKHLGLDVSTSEEETGEKELEGKTDSGYVNSGEDDDGGGGTGSSSSSSVADIVKLGVKTVFATALASSILWASLL